MVQQNIKSRLVSVNQKDFLFVLIFVKGYYLAVLEQNTSKSHI